MTGNRMWGYFRILIVTASLSLVDAFIFSAGVSKLLLLRKPFSTTASITLASAFSQNNNDDVASTTTTLIELSLPKPLGMILEEVEEGAARGVVVKEVSEMGSAFAYADRLAGGKLARVNGQDVTLETFDAVMEAIGNAPDTVDLQVEIDIDEKEPKETSKSFDIGTSVTIQALQKGKDDLNIQAKVGDNLRQVLLDNGFEVYQGMKQKLGNCGGAGQCTFCAVDMIKNEGWLERSEYEDKKLAKFPKARLACLNNIQGPATIQKTER